MSAEEVRRIALALPGTVERETWEHPTFRIESNGKIFATLWDGGAISVMRSTPEEQGLLVESEPKTFAVAPYFGRWGWIRVELASVDPTLLAELIEDAWRLAAPRRLRERASGS